MRRALASLCFLLVAIAGCFRTQTASSDRPRAEEDGVKWPKDWTKHLGQTMTLEGTAADAKFGALLEGGSGAIWIDGLEQWPEGFYPGEGKGKRLWVSGTVIVRD